MSGSLAVLVTYHDEGELLRQCLESLAAQTMGPDEVWVYDDASAVPAQPHIPGGMPVRVLRGDVNRGPSRARNALLAATGADFVHFHDADDLFAADWGRRVRQALTDDVDAVFTEVAAFTELGEVRETLGLRRLAEGEDLVRFCIQGAMLVPAGTYRRSAVVAVGGYPEALWQSEDYAFHIRLAARGVRYRIVPEPLVRVRVRPGGRSQKRREVWACAVQAVEGLAGELPARYRLDLAEAAARAGTILFDLGAREDARRGFALAARLGPPRYRSRPAAYRLLARLAGPERTESVARLYRRVVPGRLRALRWERGAGRGTA